MCRKAVRESKLMFDSNFHPTLGVSLPSFLAIQSKVLSSKSRSLWGRLNFWVLRDNITGFVSIDSKVKWFCLFHQYVYGKKSREKLWVVLIKPTTIFLYHKWQASPTKEWARASMQIDDSPDLQNCISAQWKSIKQM